MCSFKTKEVSEMNELTLKKWKSVIAEDNFRPIIMTMIRERWVKSEKRARYLIEAFLQWFLVADQSEHDKPYVMFHGSVDRVFHAFVLNTEFYSAFCKKHVGKFINHNPLDSDLSILAKNRGGIEYTIDLLLQTYGASLHPELKRWVRLADMGKLKASSISCVRCDYVELRAKTA